MRRAPPVTLAPAEEEELARWTADPDVPHRLAIRAQVILAASKGETNVAIARRLGVHTETVTRWRHRFVMNRIGGLRRDAPRGGDRARVPSPVVDRILRMTVEEAPPSGERWTTRTLARTLQVSHMLVHRVWKAHGLAPSAGPERASSAEVVAGVWVDVLGVFVGAPATAVVFGVGTREDAPDEPAVHPRMDPDRSGGYLLTRSPDPTLPIAGLLAGVEANRPPRADVRHSPHELLVFLRGLEEITRAGTTLQVILDRPLELVSSRLAAWLRAHPRYRVLTVASSGSWAVAVDTWVRSFEGVPLHPGSFSGVPSLREALQQGGKGSGAGRRLAWTLSPGLEVGPGGPPGVPAPATLRETPRARPGENETGPHAPPGGLSVASR